MIKKNNGKILNIASVAAFQPGPMMSLYYATKAFILHFTEAISNEVKDKNITISVLCPGQTKTNFQEYVSTKKNKISFNTGCPIEVAKCGYNALKNNYTLLWDMPDNTGYINIVAVMQKFFDQAISGNWSYNPEHYEDNEVPVSVLAQDLLTTYKYGWKTSYYQNTNDMKSDDVNESNLESLLSELENANEEECESCAI